LTAYFSFSLTIWLKEKGGGWHRGTWIGDERKEGTQTIPTRGLSWQLGFTIFTRDHVQAASGTAPGSNGPLSDTITF
jgi:hypothetical protein